MALLYFLRGLFRRPIDSSAKPAATKSESQPRQPWRDLGQECAWLSMKIDCADEFMCAAHKAAAAMGLTLDQSKEGQLLKRHMERDFRLQSNPCGGIVEALALLHELAKNRGLSLDDDEAMGIIVRCEANYRQSVRSSNNFRCQETIRLSERIKQRKQ
jgi:hypothetical protein